MVTGLRRVGKSTLLRQLLQRLEEQGSAFLVDMEDLAFGEIRTAQDLSEYVARLPHRENSWIIVDEVQLIDEWERAVTSINGRNGVRVIVSRSNAYPRLIISMDRTAPGTMHGVRHISALDSLSGGGIPGDNSSE